ncbi:hypothetical protein [uncultured Arthrobacter sp.]|uniref:hypothetical protein n=1 Tax=uncultured Arthrobacter sp. TaxID=114050 RepID=UPI00344DCC45
MAPDLQAFFATAGRPGSQPLIRSLFARGLQQAGGVELDLGRRVGEPLEERREGGPITFRGRDTKGDPAHWRGIIRRLQKLILKQN